MSYITSLSTEQLNNIKTIIKSLTKWKITNPCTQAGILAIISKESSFFCGFEKGYGNTSNSRIRSIFGSRVRKLSESQLSLIKKSNVAFFNLVYGGRYGNEEDEGYKYRGAGFNQITFKGNYKAAAERTGIDLIGHPELIEQPSVAADAASTYFLDKFKAGFSSRHQAHYKSTGINDFKDLTNATLAVYHANAGFGKPMYSASKANESTGGLKKAIDRAPEFLEFINGKKELPFKSKIEGDAFRNWINDVHSEYAREIDLDRSGSYTNKYILRAWNMFGDSYTPA